jgi:hypothetical protein
MTDDLIARLAETPRKLAHLVAEAGDDVLDRADGGEWSARAILAHLRDDEFMVMRLRLERMVSELEPALTDFDEKAWAANRNRSRDRKEQLLGDFALQRQASLNILQSLQPADWDRGGSHPVRGSFTIRSWVEHWASHDEEHVAQLERALGETLDDVLRRRFHPSPGNDAGARPRDSWA